MFELVPANDPSELKAHIDRCVERITSAWNADRPLYVDAIHVDALSVGSSHPMRVVRSAASSTGLKVIPVTGLDRRTAGHVAVRDFAQHAGHGVALRLNASQLPDPSTAKARIDPLLTTLAVHRGEVDLFVDLSSVESLDATLVESAMLALVARIPDLNQWRTITLAAGSFPSSLEQFAVEDWSFKRRSEWLAWRSIVAAASTARMPDYADYGVANPSLPYTGMQIASVSLRYATDDNFMVWRGRSHSRTTGGFRGMFRVCRNLCTRSEYAGRAFSAGDEEIHTRSVSSPPANLRPGNATSWRQWALSHYLELTASHFVPVP